MAASASRKVLEKLGGSTLAVYDITLTDVTEFDFATANHGFRNIISAHFNNETTEGDGLLQKNVTVAAAASLGNIALSGFTSGDVVTVTIIGN